MSRAMAADSDGGGGGERKKYKGVRRRRWGKWVSEIRVPGTPHRLWLGSYATPEAAAVAHDAAVFFLRGPDAAEGFNFPESADGYNWRVSAGGRLSPRSVQRVASDAGMAADARLAVGRAEEREIQQQQQHQQQQQQQQQNQQQNQLLQPAVLSGEYWGSSAGGDEWWLDCGEGEF